MNELHKSSALIWTLLIGFSFTFLAVLGIRSLVPPDEGRYAEMAREMLVTGDWITTRLNGIKYFEKPPLQTWMNALSFAAFGLGEWQARLWTGLCGLLGVVLTGYTGGKVFGQRVGFYAALVLGSCCYWVASGQIDSLDMGLSGMMTIALCALLIAQRDEASDAERRNWMLICWAGMALSVLSKGLIGVVLPGAVLVIYTLIARDWKLWTRLHLGKGLCLFIVLVAPWFVLVGLINPEQPHFFFIHEHFERFLLKTHHREGPWYYFFVILAVGVVPWLGMLPHALRVGVEREAGHFRPRLLLLTWAVFIFAFFSVSNSKLPGYILPIFPAVALLVAHSLKDASRRSYMVLGGGMIIVGIVLFAFTPFLSKFARYASEADLLVAWRPWILAAGFILLAGGAAAMFGARRMWRDAVVLILALSSFIAVELLLAGFEPYGRQRAGISLVPAIKAELTPETRVYSVSTYEQALTFYLERPVTLVAYTDELAFGLEQQPELAIPTLDAFVAKWTADAQAGIKDVAIIDPDVYETLKQQGVMMRRVAGDQRRLVIANQ